MQAQYNALRSRIELYFHDYKLAIEIEENCYSDRNIVCEIKRQKSVVHDILWVRVSPAI